jgi:hypothetical protein
MDLKIDKQLTDYQGYKIKNGLENGLRNKTPIRAYFLSHQFRYLDVL